MDTKIRPRKTPSQRRSNETVKAILQASAHILEREGLSRFNTNAVAERAGVSIGSLYQFFPGKDAILVALVDDFEAGMLLRFKEAFGAVRGMDLDGALRKLVSTMIEVYRDRPALYRVLEAAEDRLIGKEERRGLEMQLKAMMVAMLREHKAEVRIRLWSEAAEDVLWIVRALMNGALIRKETRWRHLERRMLRAVKGYLLLERTPTSQHREVGHPHCS